MTPVTASDNVSAFRIKGQGTIYMIGFGHASTHWVHALILFFYPYIKQEYGLSFTQIGLLQTVMHVSAILCNFGSGPLVDMSGRRVPFLLAALAGTGIGLALLGMTRSFLAICLLVGVIGAANNLWHAPGIAFLSETFPKNRGYVLAVHATGANLGDAVSPAIAGLLMLAMTWQTASIALSVPVFLSIAIVAAALLPREAPKHGPAGGRRGMSLADYLAGMVAIARNRPVRNLTLVTGVRGMAQAGIVLYVPLYLVGELKFTPEAQGLTMMLMQLGGVAASMIAGTLSDRIGRRPVVFAGLTATTVAIVGLTFVTDDLLFIAGVAVLGFALFAVRPVMQGWMMDLVPRELGGSATSVMFGVQALFAAVVPILGGIVADAWGMLEVFYLLAGFMLLANLMMFTLRGQDAEVRPG